MNISATQCKCINVPGVCQVWYAPAEEVTIPCMYTNVHTVPYPLSSVNPLNLIQGLYNSMTYTAAMSSGAQGVLWTNTVQGIIGCDDPAIITQLSKMINKRYFVIFRDNNGVYRFIQNALFTFGVDGGTINGGLGTSFSFSVQQHCPLNAYTSTLTLDNTTRSLSF